MSIKTKLRAWLIDLAREAIYGSWLCGECRAIIPPHSGLRGTHLCPSVNPSAKVPVTGSTLIPGNLKTQAQKSYADALDRAFEPSFEQMQADALKAQEDFYEPKPA